MRGPGCAVRSCTPPRERLGLLVVHRALPQRGYSPITFDAAGHGESGGKPANGLPDALPRTT
jgi:alpha-beta hydrolase superfamily lysophospholipase